MTPDQLAEDPPGPAPDMAFTDEQDTLSRLLVALSKIGLALRSHAWEDAGAHGLTPTQAQVLVLLGSSGCDGERLSTVAEKLGVTAPTVSDSVAALVRKGLVDKGRAADDARALSLTLTDAGVLASASVAEWPDLLLSSVAVLEGAEQAIFLRAMVKVIRELQERGRISPARMCVTCRFFRPNAHDHPTRPHHCAFVDAPFGDQNLRLECAEHEAAPVEQARANWARFRAGASV